MEIDRKNTLSDFQNDEACSLVKNILQSIDDKIRHKDFEKQSLEKLKHDIISFNEICSEKLSHKDTNLKQIAHDLRNCIAAVMPVADMLQDEYCSKANNSNFNSSKSEISECIKSLKAGFENASNLIREILPKKQTAPNLNSLDMVNKYNNKLKLEKINLREVINQIKILNSHSLNEHNIVFDVDMNGLSSDFIVSNKLHLSRILSNLVSNSIKFCDKNKGNIIIGIEKEFITSQSQQLSQCNNNKLQKHISISVFNNTKSNSDEELNNEKLNNNDNYKYDPEANKGHGMGLDIVKQLVSELGGKLRVNDEFSGGFEVSVKLPMNTGDLND